MAAAGRALKTEHAKVTIDIAGKPMIQKEDILHLELSAVQQAQASLLKNKVIKININTIIVLAIPFYITIR